MYWGIIHCDIATFSEAKGIWVLLPPLIIEFQYSLQSTMKKYFSSLNHQVLWLWHSYSRKIIKLLSSLRRKLWQEQYTDTNKAYRGQEKKTREIPVAQFQLQMRRDVKEEARSQSSEHRLQPCQSGEQMSCDLQHNSQRCIYCSWWW